MTDLKKPVRRSFASRGFHDSRGTNFVIELDPAGFIRIREKRSRRAYGISIEALYFLLVKQTAIEANRVRRGRRKRGE